MGKPGRVKVKSKIDLQRLVRVQLAREFEVWWKAEGQRRFETLLVEGLSKDGTDLTTTPTKGSI